MLQSSDLSNRTPGTRQKEKPNEKSRGGKDLNLYLDAISANILRIQRDLELDKKEVSAQIILNRYLGKEQSDRHTLMEVFRAHTKSAGRCRVSASPRER